MRYARLGVSEFLGTFALTFFGAGSICADAMLRGKSAFGPVDLLFVAIAHAVVLAVMVTALGHISGAHFNPAVTLAALLGRHIEMSVAVLYWVVQFVGALLAALLLNAFFSFQVLDAVHYGAPGLGEGVSLGEGVLAEAVLTFFLVIVVYATAIDPRGAFGKIAGFAIGLVLLFDILVGGVVTGAAMNPARAFGPVAAAGTIDGGHFAVYWAGPLLGAVVAGLLYQYLLLRDDGEQEVPPPATEA